jgi:Protein of unknown function (DUF3016)
MIECRRPDMPVRLQPTLSRAALLAAALLGASAPALAQLRVHFVEPDQFTDASLGGRYGTDRRVLHVLEQHLHELAARCLAPAQALEIRVLDIDLAGRQEWWNRSGAYDARVMREITWPRIDIAYTLRRSDSEVIEARDHVSDMNYLWRSAYVRSDSMPLPYERAMLTHWFEHKFCRQAATGN